MMKRLNLLCLLMAAFAGFVSCEKPEEKPEEPAKVMKVEAEQSYSVISTSPKDVTFNINSNTPWKIESDAEWCTVSPVSSDESSLVEEITVKFENNEDASSRTAKLTITGEGIENATVITFIQAPKSSLEVEPIAKAFAINGGEETFTVICNVPWTVESNMPWLTFDKTSGEGGNPETVKAICQSNEGGAVRTAVVTVNGGSEQKTFDVTQEGLFVRFVEVSAEDRTFKNLGEVKSFAIETNATELEVVTDNPGADAVAKDGAVEVTLGYNDIFTDRKVKVTVYPKGTKAEDFEGNVLEVSQPIYWTKETEFVTFDPELGTAALESLGGNKARIITPDWNKLGRYEFEIESFNAGEDFLLDFVADNRDPLVSWELAIGKNQANGLENAILLKAGGKAKDDKNANKGFVKGQTYPLIEGFSNVKKEFEFTAEDAKALKKLIIEFKPSESDPEKIDLLIQANDKELVKETLANPYLHSGNQAGKNYSYNHGARLFVGFPGKDWQGIPTNGDATMTVKSAEFTPYTF